MRKGQIKYSDNGEFMRAAYELFMKGFTAIKIAEKLGREYPGLCRQTVGKIIKEYNWKEQRFEYLDRKCSQRDEKHGYLKELKFVAERLYGIIIGTSEIEVNHQHFAQYLKCLDMIGKLSGWETGEKEKNILTTELEMNNFLDVLMGDPVMGKHWEKRKKVIQAEFLKRSKNDQAKN